jgi:hypothetical protein
MDMQYINDIHVCSECFSPHIRFKHLIYVAGINMQTKQPYTVEAVESEARCIHCGYEGLPLTAKLIKVKKEYYSIVDNANTFVVCILCNWHIKHNGQGDKILMYNSMHSIRTAAVKKNEITTALYDSITNSNMNLTSALKSFWALVSFS